MSDKYGFGIDPETPITVPKSPSKKPKNPTKPKEVSSAIKAGKKLGFVNREPTNKRKPGPKQTEPQGKISVPGPIRVLDEFKSYCELKNIPYWQGLEDLLKEASSDAS